jgi:uncharacterized repeat protein (TIGR03803 family)
MDRRTGNIAALALAALIGVSAAASAQETVLYSFKGGRDGAYPRSGLVMGADGNLYGTTSEGGKKRFSCRVSCGTVFALSPPSAGQIAWTEIIIHRFGGDGALSGTSTPYAGVTMGAGGVLYGTTVGSGLGIGDVVKVGAVFALQSPAAGETRWTEKLLHVFSGGKDGASPLGGLIVGAGGVLYGTTTSGGNSACDAGCGTVFALMPPAAGKSRWTKQVLYSFDGAGGQSPSWALRMDGAGNLFGTSGGGSHKGGTVFQLVPPGLGETRWSHRLLHSFGKDNDGSGPGGLIIDARGVLYGSTVLGGDSKRGTVFELSPPAAGETRWTETVLYSFRGGNDGRGDGAFPGGGVIMDPNGVLYGTTYYGGDSARGTVFKLTPPAAGDTQWTETVLYSFKDGNDGRDPLGGLIMDANGVLYGTTLFGGGNSACGGGCGTVFKVVP